MEICVVVLVLCVVLVVIVSPNAMTASLERNITIIEIIL